MMVGRLLSWLIAALHTFALWIFHFNILYDGRRRAFAECSIPQVYFIEISPTLLLLQQNQLHHLELRLSRVIVARSCIRATTTSPAMPSTPNSSDKLNSFAIRKNLWNANAAGRSEPARRFTQVVFMVSFTFSFTSHQKQLRFDERDRMQNLAHFTSFSSFIDPVFMGEKSLLLSPFTKRHSWDSVFVVNQADASAWHAECRQQ